VINTPERKTPKLVERLETLAEVLDLQGNPKMAACAREAAAVLSSPTPTPAPIESTLAAIAEYLIDQRDEPWPGSDSDRLHYWRSKAITAANRLTSIRTPPQSGEVSQEQVEVVGKVLYEHACAIVHTDPAQFPWEGIHDNSKEHYRSFARAAITALNPPSPPSVEVGLADKIERKIEREYWRGFPVIAYHWTTPSGFDPPSSTEVDCIAYHWSTGPEGAERLIRMTDAEAALRQQPIGVVEDGVERLREQVPYSAVEIEIFQQCIERGLLSLDDLIVGTRDEIVARARAALSSSTDTKGEAK
jgi:hypothetical protein